MDEENLLKGGNFMNTAEIRKQAKDSIKGKHLKAALIMLIYLLLTTIVSFIPILGALAIIIMAYPLSYGLTISIIKLKRNKDVGYFDFISDSFSNFGKAWSICFSILGKVWAYLLGIFLLMILIIIFIIIAIFNASSNFILIGGFIYLVAIIAVIYFSITLTTKTLYYSLSNYISIDNDTMNSKEAVEESKVLMTSNRWNLIKMQIPYYLAIELFSVIISIIFVILKINTTNSIVSSIITNIPMLYFLPLIQFSIIEFYETLKNTNIQSSSNIEQ